MPETAHPGRTAEGAEGALGSGTGDGNPEFCRLSHPRTISVTAAVAITAPVCFIGLSTAAKGKMQATNL